jgi:hypothetical protein
MPSMSTREEKEAAFATTKTRSATCVTFAEDDNDATSQGSSAASSTTMSAWEGLWKNHNPSNVALGAGTGRHPLHEGAPMGPPRTPRQNDAAGVTVRSTQKSSATRRDDVLAARDADGTAPTSSGRRRKTTELDGASLEEFWEEQWALAHQIHGRIREVRSTVTMSRDEGSSSGKCSSVRHDVDLMKSLLAMQAEQTKRLLEHLPNKVENVEDEMGRQLLRQQPELVSRGVPVESDHWQREPQKLEEEEEKKADSEDPTPPQHLKGGARSAMPLPNAMDSLATMNAPAGVDAAGGAVEDSSEWSLLGRMQQQLQQQLLQQQQPQRASGICRLATLEEVEYESDRTTPSNATATSAAATPAPAFPSGSSAIGGAAAGSEPVETPSEENRREVEEETTPAQPATTTTPGLRPRGGGGGGKRPTPWRNPHHPSPQSLLSSSYSLTSRSTYVDAPSDEMDSSLWERESNHTIDTYDLSVASLRHQQQQQQQDHAAASPSHLWDYQTSRESVGAGGSYGETQYDPEEDDDEYDSALYCATVLASDRDGRSARIRSPSDAKKDVAGELRHHDRSELQHRAVHSTPSSAFRNKVVVVDYSENQPSPTMTNITMDESEFEDVEEREGGAKCAARRGDHDLMYVNDTSTEVDHSRDYDSSTQEDDNATTTSQETPVLERYRIDLDDESPHGFTVVPNPRGSRRRSRNGSSPKVDATWIASRSPSATLLQRASMAFDSTNATSGGNPAPGEHDLLASPNHLNALLHQPLSARRRSTRKALRQVAVQAAQDGAVDAHY